MTTNEDKQPLISVIVPVYNAEKYLDQCVESILGQTYRNLEVILVDDGSPDRSGQVCDDWVASDERVSVIHRRNAGSGPARNAGLRQSKGDLISFVDADDWLMPTALETLWVNMRNESADISSGGTMIVEPTRRYPGHVQGAYIVMNYPDAFKYVNLPGYLGVVVWGKLYKMELFEGLEFPAGRAEDLPVTYAVLERARKVVLDSTPLWFYRQNAESVGHQARAGTHEPSDYTRKMLEQVRRICPENEPFATLKHMQCAVWDYQLLAQYPTRTWSSESVAFAHYVRSLLRAKSGYVRRELLAEPLVTLSRGERTRWWLIGYAPWLFGSLYRTYVRLRRDRAS